MRVRHAPALRHVIQQYIGERNDGHALVVRHHGLHWRKARALGLPRRGEVQRFDKAQATACAHRLQQREVLAR